MATFNTTPRPDWFKPLQNNTFATLGLNLIWNHSELEYVVLKNIFWAVFSLHSLILGEVRGSNSKMNYAAIVKISQQVSLNGILRFIWNQIWSNLSIFRPSLSLNLASNESVYYIADIWLKYSPWYDLVKGAKGHKISQLSKISN